MNGKLELGDKLKPTSRSGSSAINISGLPEPYPRPESSTSVKQMVAKANNGMYSSQESLQSKTTAPYRSNAGTPQFQNLSGTILQTGKSRNKMSGNDVKPMKSNIYANMSELRSSTYVSTVPVVSSDSGPKTIASSPYIMTSGGPPSGSTFESATVTPPGSGGNSRNTSGCFSASSGSSGSAASHHSSAAAPGAPSPSDSAVGDLESALRDKENEITYLRDTIEQNEQVWLFSLLDESS